MMITNMMMTIVQYTYSIKDDTSTTQKMIINFVKIIIIFPAIDNIIKSTLTSSFHPKISFVS